jgi:hypothetical protein
MNEEEIEKDIELYNASLKYEPTFKIPRCCREGDDDCPHAVQKQREKPKNPAV